jgi:anti-sigma regulatory factor (Ser/Thr protein kinase)
VAPSRRSPYAHVVEAAEGARASVVSSTGPWARHALDALTALHGVRRAGIGVSEGGGRRLNFTAAEHPGEGPATWCQIDAYDDVPLNTAIRSGRAVVGTLVELQKSHPTFAEKQAGTGTAALAAVPLVASGRTLGGFVLFYRQAPRFDEPGVRELIELGARLGDALDLTRTTPPRGFASWVREPAPGALVARLAIVNDLAAVGHARRELRATLAGWGIDKDMAETVALCMSELVTNAVVHAASDCQVRVINDAGTVTVEVRNQGPAADPTQPDGRDPLRVHGRGLQLVDALTSRWGSSRDDSGFNAWFVLNP